MRVIIAATAFFLLVVLVWAQDPLFVEVQELQDDIARMEARMLTEQDVREIVREEVVEQRSPATTPWTTFTIIGLLILIAALVTGFWVWRSKEEEEEPFRQGEEFNNMVLFLRRNREAGKGELWGTLREQGWSAKEVQEAFRLAGIQ